MTTKEELILYLETNQHKELPFCEEIWEKAVESIEGKERQFKTIKTEDYNGNVKMLKVPNGAINPVSKYFQLIALPNYKRIALNNAEEMKNNQNEDFEELDESENEYDYDDVIDVGASSFVNELTDIYFSTISGNDLQFVKNRISDYYANYEFNEGSDKFLVVSAVSDELTLRELYAKRTKGLDNENKIDKVKKGYLNTLESLKVLKRQGSKLDEGKNKFTMMLDELEKAGDLYLEPEIISEDAIKDLVSSFRVSVVRAFRDG